MAKRRKDEAEVDQETDFKAPTFDEEKFLKKERRNIKATFIAFLLGLLIALISFGFWVLLSGQFLRWELVLLFGVFNMPWLRYLYLKLNIDLAEFGRRGWISAYATYFFTWLLILIILVNPPFYDEEPPRMQVAVLPGIQEPGGTVRIVASIMDNVEVRSVNFSLTDPQGASLSPAFTFENGIFTYTFQGINQTAEEPFSPVTYNFTLAATDVNRRTSRYDGSFTYSTDALAITSSQLSNLRSGDTIAITASGDISPVNFRVFYRLDGGSEINASRREPNNRERYETSPEFEGWDENSSVTLRLYANVSFFFINNPTEYANMVTDTQVYQVTTGLDSNIGTEPSPTPSYPLPGPYTQPATPGFDVLLALAAVGIVVGLLWKRKRTRS